MVDRGTARRHRWADIVLIVASVYAVLAAMWSPLELLSGGGGGEVRSSELLWVSYALGGALGLAAVFLARRSAGVAKVLAGLGGLAVLSGFLSLGEITLLALLSLGLTGVAMLVSAPFVGPMPSPEEEGKRRTAGTPDH